MISIKLEEFIDTRSLDKLVELYEIINQKKLSVKDTGIAYRVINHWDEKGIIRCGRISEEAHRKFSFTDFIWIKVVNELRSFGVKLPVIQKIASDIYEPLPMVDVLDSLAENLDALKEVTAEDKEGFLNFIKSGEYKTADFNAFAADFNFNYLHILIAEAIATRNSVSLIVFNDGEWFPFLKSNEHLYPQDLLHKKEFVSQVRINITELIFKFILEDYLTEYLNGLHLFTPQERKLLYYIKEGDYKKVFILFKSKKHEPIEITKSKTAPDELMKILREKEYREFILIDAENNEFRIREGEPEIKAEIENDILSSSLSRAYHRNKRKRDALKKSKQ